MLPTHDVDCPKCGDVIPADAPTVPTVQSDARGDYLTCRHCQTRIAMKRITTKGRVGFRVSRTD
jgi:DNA-directed RNA polymerase subunit RPC12/RpoP